MAVCVIPAVTGAGWSPISGSPRVSPRPLRASRTGGLGSRARRGGTGHRAAARPRQARRGLRAAAPRRDSPTSPPQIPSSGRPCWLLAAPTLTVPVPRNRDQGNALRGCPAPGSTEPLLCPASATACCLAGARPRLCLEGVSITSSHPTSPCCSRADGAEARFPGCGPWSGCGTTEQPSISCSRAATRPHCLGTAPVRDGRWGSPKPLGPTENPCSSHEPGHAGWQVPSHQPQ